MEALSAVPAAGLGYVAPPVVPASSIRCIDLSATRWGTLSLFELGRGARIAPHDHPGVVLTRVLVGTVRVAAWTREAGDCSHDRCGFEGAWRLSRNVLANSGDVLVTNAAGGEHSVHAVRQEGAEPAVMLDVLLPGYQNDDGIYCLPKPLDNGETDLFSSKVGSRWTLLGLRGQPGLADHSVMSAFRYNGPALSLT